MGGRGTDVALPIILATQECFPETLACSFNHGFHSPDNQATLGERLELNAMPFKNYRSAGCRALEVLPDFAEARRQGPAVESAIHNLEQRGLDRVRTRGKAGFARTVALSTLAASFSHPSAHDLVKSCSQGGVAAARLALGSRCQCQPVGGDPPVSVPSVTCGAKTVQVLFLRVSSAAGNAHLPFISCHVRRVVEMATSTADVPGRRDVASGFGKLGQ